MEMHFKTIMHNVSIKMPGYEKEQDTKLFFNTINYSIILTAK